jgi:hypothetical protein
MKDYGAALFFLMYLTVAQAQQIAGGSFGQEMGAFPMSDWIWAALFCFVGTMSRVQSAVKAEEITLTVFGIITWCFVGIFAALLAFIGCEYLVTYLGYHIPRPVEGGVISLAAYNRTEFIALISYYLTKFLPEKKAP